MSQKTLNKTNLAALGPEILADLLLEVSTGSADIKRRLRLELSHHLGPSELGRDVRKRLVSIRKSKTYTGWRKRKSLVKDLQTQANMICDKIAVDDPTLALELLWEFVAIAPSVYERVDDSRGEVAAVFSAAFGRFADIAPLALTDPTALAEKVWAALQDNSYGEFDGIIDVIAPALGETGLTHLKQLVTAYRDVPDTSTDEDHEALIFLRSLRGEDSQPDAQKMRHVKAWLQDIAVAQGDADTYVAQYTDRDLLRPEVAAEVAEIWLNAGRSDDALSLLDAADFDARTEVNDAWDAAYVRCLSDMDRLEDAQAHRWMRFEQTLSALNLRGYLKLLPDFEDVEAEDRAKTYALRFPQFHAALGFFLDWPDLALAAHLIETSTKDIPGDFYWRLTPAVDVLRQRYPLAAVLILRAMLTDALRRRKLPRYADAADQLKDCAALDADIVDYGKFETHSDFVQQLKMHHGTKSAFWSKLDF